MMNKWARVVGVLAGSVGLAACFAASPPAQHALPVTQPFAIDKAGATTTIDFQVVPGVNIKRRLMVALDFPQTKDGGIEDRLLPRTLPMHVQVLYEDHGQTIPIATQDDDAILKSHDAGPPVPGGTVAHMELYAHDGHTSNVMISGFYVTRYGHYKAIVTTVQDLPMFRNVKTVLKVDEFYNTGL